MTENILKKLFEHNTWANLQMIQACSALSNEQLDAQPQSVTKGSIRRTLWHLVDSQRSYLSTLTGRPRVAWEAAPSFDELRESASFTGEMLLELTREEPNAHLEERKQTRDGYLVEPWVVMVQIINHATEHREQISSMITSLGMTPPDLDGWAYGKAMNALTPLTT
jgi:uncharacterized damage-inducible protein DinB